jgi:dinuclear metal center YbgI/SA1388 family protein
MPTVAEICSFLDRFAPPFLAENWDNVGLVVGRGDTPVSSAMTCLTATRGTVAEAVQQNAQLVITHHPLPFRPLNRITCETVTGRLLLQLIENGIAVYSPHTAFDSARQGINEWLSEIIGIVQPQPLVPQATLEKLGTGRCGELAANITVADVALRLKLALGQQRVLLVGDAAQTVRKAAVGCGSAGELLDVAIGCGCDLFVTGEARFHTCLDAEAHQMAMILVGHYASERFALDRLADILSVEFAGLKVWASREERDPLSWY